MDNFDIENEIRKHTHDVLSYLTDEIIPLEEIKIVVSKEYDYTIVLFSLAKYFNFSVEKLSEYVGCYIKYNMEEIKEYSVSKGYVNLNVTDKFLLDRFYGQCCTCIKIN